MTRESKQHSQNNYNALLNSLKVFYQNPNHLNILLSLINNKSNVSLRLIDWFITNYCRTHKIVIIDETNGKCLHVYEGYRQQLKAYTKVFFDPFRRHHKNHEKLQISYDSLEQVKEESKESKDKQQTNKHVIETTIGQLNFFKWIIEYELLNYIIAHYKDISIDMSHSAIKKKKTTEESSSDTKKSNSMELDNVSNIETGEEVKNGGEGLGGLEKIEREVNTDKDKDEIVKLKEVKKHIPLPLPLSSVKKEKTRSSNVVVHMTHNYTIKFD
jgi:hypothetical protein